MSIEQNLRRVQEQLAAACARAGRDPAGVQLMAVSKTHPVSALREAWDAGQRVFGENRVQEMQSKAPELEALDGMDIHLIGPLQNNKTARAAELFQAVDTVDELKTAERLNDAAGRLGRILPILIEVKLSPEIAKHGVLPEALPALLNALAPLPHLRLAGLMTVPPMEGGPEGARPYFQQLRRLRDDGQKICPTLTELSMGMSGDFEVAIEEGSTTVRVGTAIFGRREPA